MIELRHYLADIAGLRTTPASLPTLRLLAAIVCPPSLRPERTTNG